MGRFDSKLDRGSQEGLAEPKLFFSVCGRKKKKKNGVRTLPFRKDLSVLTGPEKCDLPISIFFGNKCRGKNVTLEISRGTDSRPYRFDWTRKV